jgi:DNA polymerase III alpha subunit (gram-positive type)
VKKIFNKCCKENNVTKIFAHNARFDYKSLQTTLRYITTSKMRFFFPYGVEIWDTLKMSRAVFKDDENYGEFCYRNDFLTKRGCRKYTAEVLYRFLTDDVTFIEEHKGLDDVMIEKEIMSECFKRVTDLDGRLWAD